MDALGPAIFLFTAAGYVTLRTAYLRSYRLDAVEWQRTIFESSVAGLALFLAARLLIISPPPPWPPVQLFLAWLRPTFDGARAVVHLALPFQFSGSLVGMFILGLSVAFVANGLYVRPLKTWIQRAAARMAVQEFGGDMSILLHDAAEEGMPVSLTLHSRKVYVGLVVVPPGLRKPSHVRFLPTISGYRHKDTLELYFT